MSDDMRILKSYVWHKDQCFFVSTIERDSSAMFGPRRFNETMVWKYNYEARIMDDKIFAQEEDCAGGIRTHLRVVDQLFLNGKLSEEE